MAAKNKANPLLKTFKEYLFSGFPWRENFHSPQGVYSYYEVKQGLRELKKARPIWFQSLCYQFLTKRSRFDVANALFIDDCTYKRRSDLGMRFIYKYMEDRRTFKAFRFCFRYNLPFCNLESFQVPKQVVRRGRKVINDFRPIDWIRLNKVAA